MSSGLLLEFFLAFFSLVATVRARPLLTSAITTAGFHSCALLEDQTAKCWGNNMHGHLGYEDLNNRGDEVGEMGDSLPVLDFGEGRRPVKLSGGEHHNCAVLDNGDLKCWGRGTEGQLGQGDTLSRGSLPGEMGDALPTVNLGIGLRVVEIASGDFHTCAILNNSKLKCWGQGAEGQLGYGNSEYIGNHPLHMGDSLPFVDLGEGQLVAGITCGDFHTCALLVGGTVKCFGDSVQGQLGYGSTHRRGDHPEEMGNNLPAVDLGTNRTATKVTAGLYHSCALLDDATVKCWGYGGHGQLGQGTEQDIGKMPGQMGDDLPPVDLGTGRTAVDISCGGTFTCALLDNGWVKCWGENDAGQLAQGDTAGRGNIPGTMGDSMPPIALGTGRTAVAVSSGDRHSCVVLDNGRVKCWGENGKGQLGLESNMTYGDISTTLGDALPVVELGMPTTQTTTNSATTTISTSVTSTDAPASSATVTVTVTATPTATSSSSTSLTSSSTSLTSLSASAPSTSAASQPGTDTTTTTTFTATASSSTVSSVTTTPRPVVEAIAESTVTDLGFTWSGTPPEPLRVMSVQADSWAAQAGLKAGDEIMALNRNQVATMTPGEVTQALQSSRPLSVTFAPTNLSPGGSQDQGQGQGQSDRFAATLTQADVQAGFTVADGQGDQAGQVVVAEVQPGSWAERAGLKPWDRLVAVGGVAALGMSAAEVAQQLQSTRPLRLIFTPGQAPATANPSTSTSSTGAGQNPQNPQDPTTSTPPATSPPWWLRTSTTTTADEPWFQTEFLVDSAQLGGRLAMSLWSLVLAATFW